MISASNIVKSYGDVKVLKGIDLQIKQGEIVSITGRSGAGKSTLLLTIDPADLNITPHDTTIVYNDSIAGIGFNYVFNNGSGLIPMIASDSLAILNAVKSTHGIAMVNAAALVRGIAMVNNDGDPLLSDSLLSNFSFMISQAVSSTRGIAMVNGELIDPEELYTAAAFTTPNPDLYEGWPW